MTKDESLKKIAQQVARATELAYALVENRKLMSLNDAAKAQEYADLVVGLWDERPADHVKPRSREEALRDFRAEGGLI